MLELFGIAKKSLSLDTAQNLTECRVHAVWHRQDIQVSASWAAPGNPNQNPIELYTERKKENRHSKYSKTTQKRGIGEEDRVPNLHEQDFGRTIRAHRGTGGLSCS